MKKKAVPESSKARIIIDLHQLRLKDGVHVDIVEEEHKLIISYPCGNKGEQLLHEFIDFYKFTADEASEFHTAVDDVTTRIILRRLFQDARI